MIGVEAKDEDFESGRTKSADEPPICQKLINLSLDIEMRLYGEEKTSEGLDKARVWSSDVPKFDCMMSSYSNEPSIGGEIATFNAIVWIEFLSDCPGTRISGGDNVIF